MEKFMHRFSKLDKIYLDAVPPNGIRIKHVDYFSMKHLYTLTREWLVEEGWATRKDEDFPEEFYFQKETQQWGVELWIWWRHKKNTKNSYYRYLLDIDFHVLALKQSEIVRNGQKYKVDHADCEIMIKAKILSDAEDKWKNHPFLKHFQTIFWKRINKNIFEGYKRDLYQQVYRLQETMKSYLQLKTYLPEEEGEQFWLTKQET